MPAPKNTRSKERPAIGRIDLERMWGELHDYARLRQELPDDMVAVWMDRIRPILSDPRLAGHFGYVEPKKAEKMRHEDLQRHAIVLQAWVERWLR